MKYEYGYLVDNVWKCSCGSLNAATLTICPECKTSNPKNNE